MVEFKSDNGRRGVERVSRTATGYRMTVYNPGNSDTHLLEEDGIEMLLGRGVEEKSGTPYIEIEFMKMNKEGFRDAAFALVKEACAQKGYNVRISESSHGNGNLSFHVDHNCLSDVFAALLLINLPNGQPLVPDVGRNFVTEQQQVRHGLEQSLLNAFGQDMYARAKPSTRNKGESNHIPKSEINRIARLVDYFRNGLPNMTDIHGGSGAHA